MKTLLLTLTLTALGPAEISDKAMELAERHKGDVGLTTSELITWLYAEGGVSDTLGTAEIENLKNIVRSKCGVVEVKKQLKLQIKSLEDRKDHLDRAVQHQQRINEEQRAVLAKLKKTHPAKDWYDDIKLTLTYANGYSYIHSLRLYGYIDPANPPNFIFDPAEQTDYVKSLINGVAPAPIPVIQPYSYTGAQPGSIICTTSGCYRIQ